ncbi:hypothetical protein [Pseudomonas sp. MWU16_30322]|uniref:DUF6124 family protein n=1 Tax=Pseudomonas sp. MWU16-30322 TaxID=2878092 RepID=UPI001CFBE82E
MWLIRERRVPYRPVYQPAHGRHPSFGSEGDGSYFSIRSFIHSSRIFLIDPAVDEETLLVEACESLAAASDMARDIGDVVDHLQRRAMLMLHQVIMFSELMVNRVLDGRRVPN